MSQSTSELREYVYVDERRLEAYFVQISNPVAYDKVPVWKAGLSSVGPMAEGQQTRVARSFTAHEKIVAVTKHLDSHGFLQKTGRPWEGPSFDLQALTATRVLIPARSSNGFQVPGLAIWVASRTLDDRVAGERNIEHFYVIEDANLEDRDSPRFFSGFSALHLLLDELEASQRERFCLNTHGPGEVVRRDAQRFSRDPMEFLRSLGGVVLTPQPIKALYRVRAICADENSVPQYCPTVVGYAIAVWLDGGPNSQRAVSETSKDTRSRWPRSNRG